jgi:S-disulfanyl-L-cysteine oxidoreductase SoxD
MFTLRTVSLAAVLTFAFGSTVVFAAGANLGRPISEADTAAWDIDVEPSGAGLPAGSGTSDQGAAIFAVQCSACHGEGGRGAATTTSGAPAAPPVVSDVKRNGIDDTTLTIANYWPYAPTLFDYIRRSMPWTSPRSLSDDQVYALTAYILAQNKLIDAKQVINAQTLPKVQMPNRNGFIPRFPERMPPSVPTHSFTSRGEACQRLFGPVALESD